MKLTWLMDFYINNNVSNAIQIIISIAVIFSVAFLLTRLTKLVKLPNVTAYIISGVIIGPYVLNMIPEFMIDGMSFLSDVAMAFIAFSIGRYFDIASLKKGLGKIVVITLFETIFATVGVGLLMWAFNLPIYIALLLGSIAATTSSVSTMMTIKQYCCTGEFVETTLKVIAFDNIISLILFSLMLSISKANLDSSSNNVFLTIFLPILLNILVILIGGFFGFILSKIITPNRTKDNRLILTVAMNLFLVGICGLLSLIDKNVSLSPLLGSMAFGVIYVNLTKDSKIVSQLSDFGAPITLLFFVRSGMSFNLPSLLNIGLIGLVYLVSRVVFKYLG
ncbi:MAG: cation:proton antiporter, partial [Bacilli bacterium]|nr:cation:proton antiporter [Bacilli bacterium]